MNTAILLCVALLAADDPAQVQAKVLYGSEPRNEQVADIEPWISQAVAKTGSPLALPVTDWVALTGDEQRLYTSMQGGFIIDGKAAERNGMYEVEINGCEGVSLQQTATLKPGERRVVKLTDNPAPNNVFIALQAPVTEQAQKRAEAMKASAKTFRLELNYHGQEDKPFYRLVVSVPEVGEDRGNPLYRIVQVNEEQAIRIIDHLTRDGFLDNAVDPRNNIKLLAATMPGYTMKVVTGDVTLYEDLGWGLTMIQRFDELRAALPDTGKKDMDFLLGRLAGLRKQWAVEAKPD